MNAPSNPEDPADLPASAADAASTSVGEPVTDETQPVAGVRPVDLRDYVTFSEQEATCVRVHATRELALDLWCLQPRQATPVLHHEDARITYTVIGGRSWFVTDEGEIGLDPMGSMLVSPGVVHGIDNRAADPLIVIAAASPPTSGGGDPAARTDQAAVRHTPGPR